MHPGMCLIVGRTRSEPRRDGYTELHIQLQRRLVRLELLVGQNRRLASALESVRQLQIECRGFAFADGERLTCTAQFALILRFELAALLDRCHRRHHVAAWTHAANLEGALRVTTEHPQQPRCNDGLPRFCRLEHHRAFARWLASRIANL